MSGQVLLVCPILADTNFFLQVPDLALQVLDLITQLEPFNLERFGFFDLPPQSLFGSEGDPVFLYMVFPFIAHGLAFT